MMMIDDDDNDFTTHPPESHERQEVQNHQTSIFVCDYKLNVCYILAEQIQTAGRVFLQYKYSIQKYPIVRVDLPH